MPTASNAALRAMARDAREPDDPDDAQDEWRLTDEPPPLRVLPATPSALARPA